MSSTGKLIQELRIKAGFTQKTLAEALHITDRAISKWERGYSLPDITLLPRLSLLLDVDVGILISQSIEEEEWIGLIDIYDCDFSQIVYDKPLIFYILSHFLLLGIKQIYVLTNESNEEYLKSSFFYELGLQFLFEKPNTKRTMIINHPWFLFGSDLTHQFQGAMVSGRNMKLVPQNQDAVFFFAQNIDHYFSERKKFEHRAAERTLGRGMICIDMCNQDTILDVASFVRIYQRNTGILIASLEEIAYRKGIIINQQLMKFAEMVPYGELLRNSTQPQVN